MRYLFCSTLLPVLCGGHLEWGTMSQCLHDFVMFHRYDELKKSGKLNQFLTKKRKRNSNKDHKKIPYRREQDA